MKDSNFLPLARKYRPQNFDEVVGQIHVTRTLKNAIRLNKIASAYIFTGPRGVGKTSVARILARSLNCKDGPTLNPCNKCAACREISQGVSMDVIEIDGASNRGIDEIRNLRENVKFASILGKYKIYIIDEVHMLTQEAFNALLKTLEEPPLHVKFIFATTNPQKVIPTVLSRCQRFDFRRIPDRAICEKLKEIRDKENIKLTDEAIHLIARSADGSMRDAEVILDQLLSFSRREYIKPEDVIDLLGALERDRLSGIVDAIIEGRKERVIGIINELIETGKEPAFIATSIIEYLRDLIIVKVSHKGTSLLLATESQEVLKTQSERLALEELLYMVYVLIHSMELIKKTSLGRIPLEIGLIKLSQKVKIVNLKDALEKLMSIENILTKSSLQLSSVGEIGELVNEKVKESIKKFDNESTIKIASVDSSKSHITVHDRGSDKFKYYKEEEISEEAIAEERDILLFQKIKERWPQIINILKSRKMSLATCLMGATLLGVKERTLKIGFTKEHRFNKDSFDENSNRKLTEEILHSIIGENILLKAEFIEEEIIEEKAKRESELVEHKFKDEGEIITERDSEIVESTLELFEGRIIGINNMDKKEK